jgi:hypothetical protein
VPSVEEGPTVDYDGGMSHRATLADEASEFLFPGQEQRSMPFTEAEFDRISSMYNQGTSAAKVALIERIARTQGKRAVDVFEHFNEKGAFQMSAAGAMSMENRQDISFMLVQGMEIRKNEPELAPDSLFSLSMNEALGSSYERGTPTRKTAEKAIMAIYASLASRPGSGVSEGVLDEDTFEQAVNLFTGGLVTFRGETMPVPERGRTQDDFDNWYGGLKPSDFQGIAGHTPEQAFETLKGSKNNARLIQRRKGQYAVGWYGPSNNLEVGFYNTDGTEFLLNYQDTEPPPPWATEQIYESPIGKR